MVQNVDKVNHPVHYADQGEIECIDFITVMVAPYQGVVAGDLQNVVKYTWRADYKNGIEDLKKALWYARHATKQIHFQLADINRLSRAWRTVVVERTPEEDEILKKAVKQVKKHLTENEKIFFDIIVNAIVDGNLYRKKAEDIALITALEDWISHYDEEKAVKRGV